MAVLGKARQGLGAAPLHPEHSFLLIFTAELPIAVMDTFNNALGTEGGATNNHKGGQEGRTDAFKHTGRDSSHLTNHVKMRCVLILALSVAHAGTGSFQKTICAIPKGYP